MMNCEDAARLISESKDIDLPWHRKLGLRFHLALCKICRIYNAQMDMLSRISARAGELAGADPKAPAGPSLSHDCKNRIKKRLTDIER